jgi:hypothetical protein
LTLIKTKTGVTEIPQKMIIYSPPKTGKTKSLSNLPDGFILDLESGTRSVTGQILDVKQEIIDRDITDAGERAKAPWQIISEFYSELVSMGNKIPFKHLVIDTVDELETAARYIIWSEQGEDPLNMDFGKGYGLIRDRIMKLLNLFVGLGLNVILVGHRKKSIIEKANVKATDKNVKAIGTITVTTNDLEVTGRLKSILFAWADCIGFGNRIISEEGNSGFYLSFIRDSEDNMEAGSRIAKLEGRNILIYEMNGKGETVTNNWEEIFPKGE